MYSLFICLILSTYQLKAEKPKQSLNSRQVGRQIAQTTTISEQQRKDNKNNRSKKHFLASSESQAVLCTWLLLELKTDSIHPNFML